MKNITKKVMTGTLAAALLIGGATGLYSQVYAASSDSTTSTTDQAKTNGQGGKGGHVGQRGEGFRGGNLTQEAAKIIGIDEQTLKDELKQNKTLAQVAQEKAGLSQDALLQKLVAAETTAIQEAVKAGKLTQEQADKILADVSTRLTQAITGTHPAPGQRGDNNGPRGKGGGFGPFGSQEQLSTILGVTQDELKAALESGKSLAEIAQEKGISEAQLIEKIKASLDDNIKQFVERKHEPKAAKDKTTAPSSQSAKTSA